jgi:hypothetical protein
VADQPPGLNSTRSSFSVRYVIVVAAGHVEPAWLVEGPVVGVRRPVHQQHLVTCPQELASHLMLGRDRAAHVEHRGRVPDELLHRGSPDHRRVRPQDLMLLGKADQVPDRLADDGPSRLRAAVQQQQAFLDDLGRVQRLAVHGAVHPR